MLTTAWLKSSKVADPPPDSLIDLTSSLHSEETFYSDLSDVSSCSSYSSTDTSTFTTTLKPRRRLSGMSGETSNQRKGDWISQYSKDALRFVYVLAIMNCKKQMREEEGPHFICVDPFDESVFGKQGAWYSIHAIEKVNGYQQWLQLICPAPPKRTPGYYLHELHKEIITVIGTIFLEEAPEETASRCEEIEVDRVFNFCRRVRKIRKHLADLNYPPNTRLRELRNAVQRCISVFSVFVRGDWGDHYGKETVLALKEIARLVALEEVHFPDDITSNVTGVASCDIRPVHNRVSQLRFAVYDVEEKLEPKEWGTWGFTDKKRIATEKTTLQKKYREFWCPTEDDTNDQGRNIRLTRLNSMDDQWSRFLGEHQPKGMHRILGTSEWCPVFTKISDGGLLYAGMLIMQIELKKESLTKGHKMIAGLSAAPNLAFFPQEFVTFGHNEGMTFMKLNLHVGQDKYESNRVRVRSYDMPVPIHFEVGDVKEGANNFMEAIKKALEIEVGSTLMMLSSLPAADMCLTELRLHESFKYEAVKSQAHANRLESEAYNLKRPTWDEISLPPTDNLHQWPMYGDDLVLTKKEYNSSAQQKPLLGWQPRPIRAMKVTRDKYTAGYSGSGPDDGDDSPPFDDDDSSKKYGSDFSWGDEKRLYTRAGDYRVWNEDNTSIEVKSWFNDEDVTCLRPGAVCTAQTEREDYGGNKDWEPVPNPGLGDFVAPVEGKRSSKQDGSGGFYVNISKSSKSDEQGMSGRLRSNSGVPPKKNSKEGNVADQTWEEPKHTPPRLHLLLAKRLAKDLRDEENDANTGARRTSRGRKPSKKASGGSGTGSGSRGIAGKKGSGKGGQGGVTGSASAPAQQGLPAQPGTSSNFGITTPHQHEDSPPLDESVPYAANEGDDYDDDKDKEDDDDDGHDEPGGNDDEDRGGKDGNDDEDRGGKGGNNGEDGGGKDRNDGEDGGGKGGNNREDGGGKGGNNGEDGGGKDRNDGKAADNGEEQEESQESIVDLTTSSQEDNYQTAATSTPFFTAEEYSASAESAESTHIASVETSTATISVQQPRPKRTSRPSNAEQPPPKKPKTE